MREVCKMKNEQEYIILQIQEDDYGCEGAPCGGKEDSPRPDERC